MKKLILGVSALLLISVSAFADEARCVDTEDGELCGAISQIQDTKTSRFTYEITDFTLNGKKRIEGKAYSANFLCENLIPHAHASLPFGLSKRTVREIAGWVMYTNGDCRPMYERYLKSVSCVVKI